MNRWSRTARNRRDTGRHFEPAGGCAARIRHDRAQFRLALRQRIRGIYTFDGELVHFAGAYGFSPEQLNGVRAKYPVRVDDRSVLSSRAILAKAPVHIQDVMSDPHYDREHASMTASRRLLAVPMLREGVPLGAIVAAWAELLRHTKAT